MWTKQPSGQYLASNQQRVTGKSDKEHIISNRVTNDWVFCDKGGLKESMTNSIWLVTVWPTTELSIYSKLLMTNLEPKGTKNSLLLLLNTNKQIVYILQKCISLFILFVQLHNLIAIYYPMCLFHNEQNMTSQHCIQLHMIYSLLHPRRSNY